VTTASRLAIDRLRRLKIEREAYVGPWLPEPIVTTAAPDRDLDLADDLSIAFLTLLERLAPDERAALLLHDVFDVGYAEIAAVLERSEAACRQVVHRARTRVRGQRKRFDVKESAKAALLQKFTAAMEARDEQALLALFAPDATWTADGGGKTGAAPRPIVGADRIARLVIGLREKFWAVDRTIELSTVNGETGLCLRDGNRLTAVLTIATDGERILDVYAVVNPDKLG
jgi:RNA polymerase sigma-70 factor (ECF subfamily)